LTYRRWTTYHRRIAGTDPPGLRVCVSGSPAGRRRVCAGGSPAGLGQRVCASDGNRSTARPGRTASYGFVRGLGNGAGQGFGNL
jgi:hypothetical protein